MSRDYHAAYQAIGEQLKRIADLLERAEERAKRSEPMAVEVLELSLQMQRKLAQEL